MLLFEIKPLSPCSPMPVCLSFVFSALNLDLELNRTCFHFIVWWITIYSPDGLKKAFAKPRSCEVSYSLWFPFSQGQEAGILLDLKPSFDKFCWENSWLDVVFRCELMLVCILSLSCRLALYVYEYLLHVGAQKSAQTFLSEVGSKTQEQHILNSRNYQLNLLMDKCCTI